MDNESILTDHDDAANAGESTPAATTSVDVVDELLIEEISIDGMCGVY